MRGDAAARLGRILGESRGRVNRCEVRLQPHRAMLARLDHALEQTLAQDRQCARRARHDDVELREPFRHLVQRDRLGGKARRELPATFERPVGDRDRPGIARGEVRCREIDHFPRADEQDPLLGDRWEDALGQLHRGRRHRDRRAADLGLGADILCHGERPLEQPVQHEPQRACGFGVADGLLHLAQDLRLAQHHRIEARGDTERVGHRLFARQCVEVRREGIPRHSMELLEPLDHRPRLRSMDVELGTVARRQDRRFLDRGAGEEVAQRVTETFGREGDPFAHVERRGRVIQAEGVKGHA